VFDPGNLETMGPCGKPQLMGAAAVDESPRHLEHHVPALQPLLVAFDRQCAQQADRDDVPARGSTMPGNRVRVAGPPGITPEAWLQGWSAAVIGLVRRHRIQDDLQVPLGDLQQAQRRPPGFGALPSDPEVRGGGILRKSVVWVITA
jgi:hypothetical protein